MKNTMKKLLCMTLVIMLLISAVPMFAAADANVAVSITKDDGTIKNEPMDIDTSLTLEQALSPFFAEHKANCNITYFRNGTEVDGGTLVGADATSIGAVLVTMNAPITVKFEDGSRQGTVYRPITGSFTLNEALLNEAKIYVPSDKKISGWNVNGSAKNDGTSMNVDWNLIAVCLLEDKDTPDTSTGSGSGSTGGSGSGSSTGTGTLTKFKASFLNANGIQFYSEEAVSNAKLTVSASTLNNGVGTKAGYEHIGWKSSAGKTQTTDELLRDTITANVTYAPIFKNLTNNTTEVPGSGIISGGSGTVSNGSGSALHDKVSDLQDVILHVYLNNNFNSEHKHYTITDIAKDGTLSLKGDVKDFLKKYYTAKTSDGIGYDGMYVTDAYFGVKYLSDEKYEVLGNDGGNGPSSLDRMRSAGVVHLNVMLTNAVAKSSSTADTSNYKTGDTIFVPVMAMGLTGTLLAAAYIFGKKRFAR